MDGGDAQCFRVCECVSEDELIATRQLLDSVQQQQQQACTESECFSEIISGTASDTTTALFLMSLWLLVAAVLFFVRPKTNVAQTGKSGDQGGPNSEPPAPPALS